MAQNSHCHSQNNVNNIISGSSSIRISSSISGNDSEGALVSSCNNRCGSVESEEIYELASRLEKVESGNSGEECGNDIISGEVGWSN